MRVSYREGGKVFADRHQAGRELAAQLAPAYAGIDCIVLGLPRGGVAVAYEVATALRAPLDVLVVRKIGAPSYPELALGAIATGGIKLINRASVAALGVDEADLERVIEREEAELARRERIYRAGRGPLKLDGKIAILVDDGIATGATMEAAVEAARALKPAEVVVAAPTAAMEALESLAKIADAVAVLYAPVPYIAVGAWYVSFPQLTDQEVVDLLERSRTPAGGTP